MYGGGLRFCCWVGGSCMPISIAISGGRATSHESPTRQRPPDARDRSGDWRRGDGADLDIVAIRVVCRGLVPIPRLADSAYDDILDRLGQGARRDAMLVRDNREALADACFRFLPVRARLDLQGWDDADIFAHS